MKVGFTPRDVYSMYRSLSREVFSFYNYAGPMPKFTARMTLSVGEYAHADFVQEGFVPPTGILAWLVEVPTQEYANTVRVNPAYLPYLHEDELIGILLHELAHCVAGYAEAHSRRWATKSRDVGGHDEDILVIRNWESLPYMLRPPLSTVERYGIYYAR